MKNLGKVVRKIRMDKKMSIEDLAKITELSETYLYRLETDNEPMFSDEILTKLCEAFGVNKATLIGASMGEDEKIYPESDLHFLTQVKNAIWCIK